ncbi:hypothetical protein Tco_1237978 [Tanacetum coccineum]
MVKSHTGKIQSTTNTTNSPPKPQNRHQNHQSTNETTHLETLVVLVAESDGSGGGGESGGGKISCGGGGGVGEDDDGSERVAVAVAVVVWSRDRETAQEIWLRVQQMMKGSDIGIQEKTVKLFNEWERFSSTDWESIESYYHRFLKLMNDFKRNKHFPEKIASNLKFLNNLQPEWSRHVTIIHQTKDLHTADYT